MTAPTPKNHHHVHHLAIQIQVLDQAQVKAHKVHLLQGLILVHQVPQAHPLARRQALQVRQVRVLPVVPAQVEDHQIHLLQAHLLARRQILQVRQVRVLQAVPAQVEVAQVLAVAVVQEVVVREVVVLEAVAVVAQEAVAVVAQEVVVREVVALEAVAVVAQEEEEEVYIVETYRIL